LETIRKLMAAPEPKKRKIGFLVEEKSRGLRKTTTPKAGEQDYSHDVAI
jgi:hypothetical protein